MATSTEISKLFIALFNRAVDANTFATYNPQAYNQALINNIIDTDSTLKAMSNQEFVELFYKNALGKSVADDPEGVAFWVKAMTDNNWNQAQFLDAILSDVNDYVTGKKPATPSSTMGITVFNAKLEISEEAAKTIGNVDAFYLTFGGGLPEINANNADTAKATALDAIANIALRNPAPISGGNTVSLTAENPNFLPPAEGQSGSATSATDADDTINAVVNGANSTLLTSSRIDAAKGNDTLNVDMKTDFAGLLGSGSITNVENINLTNTVASGLSFNAQGIDGVYTYNISGENSVNLSNVSYNKALQINLKGAKNAGTSITFNSDTAPSDGTLNFGLENVGSNTQAHNVQINGVNKVLVQLTGNNYANFGSDAGTNGITSVSVGGSGSLTTKLAGDVTYFNGSSTKGKLDIDASTAVASNQKKFTHFSTGDGNDNVVLDVRRLKDDADIDLGAGNDTLTFKGQSSLATRQYYHLGTVENLVFNNTNVANNILTLDLGTVRIGEFGENITTSDRSANLQSVTFEDGANVTLANLGQKNLNVTYKGGNASQTVSLDHTGTTNLILAGSKTVAGNIKLDNTTGIKLSLDGQNFNGFLSAAKATQLDITNLSADKSFVLTRGTNTTSNNWNSVETLNITTEAAAGEGVNVTYAEFAAIKNVNLAGAGRITLGNLNNSGGITIDGTAHTGVLNTGTINAGTGTLNITTTGAITTGTLTGNNVTIDLTNATRNNMGDIRLTDNGSQALLDYKTSQSGIVQRVDVQAAKAALTLNGQDGNDNFDIFAAASTNEITLSGNLGTGRDAVVVDLSASTAGVKLDTSNLAITQEGFGVEIQLSKGKDVITLGNSNETIKVNAGANAAGNEETATVTAVELRTGEYLVINGRTLAATKNQTASAVAKAIKAVLEGSSAGEGFATTGDLRGNIAGDWSIATSSGAVLTFTSKEKANVRDLSDVLIIDSAGVATRAGDLMPNTTNGVSAVTTAMGATATGNVISASITASNAAGGATSTSKVASATSSDAVSYTLKVGNTENTISIKPTSNSSKFSATTAAKIIAAVVNNTTLASGSIANVTEVKIDNGNNLIQSSALTKSGMDYLSGGWKLTASDGKLKIDPDTSTGVSQPTTLPGDVTITASSSTVSLSAPTAATTKTSTITIAGLKTSATDTAKDAAVEITAIGSTGVTATNAAKIIAAIIEGTSLASGSVGHTTSVKLNGTELLESGAIKATGNDLTGAGWRVEDSSGKLKLSPTATQGMTAPDYSLNLTVKVDDMDISNAGVVGKGLTDPIKATLSISFSDLQKGQYYTFDGKTFVALRDVTGEDLARAFAGKGDSTKIGVNGTDYTTVKASEFDVTFNGKTVTFTQKMASDKDLSSLTVVGGGAGEVAGVSIETTQQGESTGLQFADSYVMLDGNAGTSSEISNYIINTNSKLDDINNFNTNVDKISLNKVGSVGKLTKADMLDTATGLSSVWVNDQDGTITKLTGSIENGIITFDQNATLGQKLGALSNIAQNKIVAFRDGNDLYVVAGGADSTKNTDDVVIKLAGVGQVSDLGSILG